MKKITLSVAALSLAISSFGQPNDSTYVSQEASYAEKLHKNLYSVVINAEDMLFQIKQDEDSGFILDGRNMFNVLIVCGINWSHWLPGNLSSTPYNPAMK